MLPTDGLIILELSEEQFQGKGECEDSTALSRTQPDVDHQELQWYRASNRERRAVSKADV
jgi:hypothetical protein